MPVLATVPCPRCCYHRGATHRSVPTGQSARRQFRSCREASRCHPPTFITTGCNACPRSPLIAVSRPCHPRVLKGATHRRTVHRRSFPVPPTRNSPQPTHATRPRCHPPFVPDESRLSSVPSVILPRCHPPVIHLLSNAHLSSNRHRCHPPETPGRNSPQPTLETNFFEATSPELLALPFLRRFDLSLLRPPERCSTKPDPPRFLRSHPLRTFLPSL